MTSGWVVLLVSGGVTSLVCVFISSCVSVLMDDLLLPSSALLSLFSSNRNLLVSLLLCPVLTVSSVQFWCLAVLFSYI